MDLNEIKQYIRVDGTYDDDLLLTLKTVSESYIRGAIDNPEIIETDPRFKFAVCLLVSFYYDNRDVVINGTPSEIPYGVLALIQQLRGVESGEIIE